MSTAVILTLATAKAARKLRRLSKTVLLNGGFVEVESEAGEFG